MRLTDFLQKEHVKVFLQGKSKEELINELSETLLSEQTDSQLSEAKRAVFERETISSTGIGKGIGIPHARLGFIDNLVTACGLTSEPVEFNSIDKKPVNIVFLILCPTSQPNMQIRFLARASRILNDDTLRDQLCACTTADELYQTIVTYENKHFN